MTEPGGTASSLCGAGAGLGQRMGEVCSKIGTRIEAAAIADVSVAQLGRYINGEQTPGVDVVVALAVKGGASVEWLATGAEPELDLALLHDCTQALEEMLTEKGAHLAPDKKAKALVLIVEYFSKIGKIDRADLERIIDLAA